MPPIIPSWETNINSVQVDRMGASRGSQRGSEGGETHRVRIREHRRKWPTTFLFSFLEYIELVPPVNWKTEAVKPNIILGDSNLGRILDLIQFNSYPGANMYHFSQLLQKPKVFPLVKTEIFSIGLNNRNQDKENFNKTITDNL